MSKTAPKASPEVRAKRAEYKRRHRAKKKAADPEAYAKKQREAAARYRAKDPEKVKESVRKRTAKYRAKQRAEKPEKYAQKNHEHFMAWRDRHPVRYLLRLAKARAEKKGLPFDITEADLQMPTHCPALGLKLALGGDQDSSPSIDRFIPDRGYVKGNVAIISSLANQIKSTASAEQVLAVGKWMRDNQPTI